MKRVRTKGMVIYAVALTFFVTAAVMSAEQTQPIQTQPITETFQAIMVSMGNVKGMSNAQITITRWTTDAEREELAQALLEKGQEELTKKLEKQDETGFIRLPNTLGYRLRYAREFRKGNTRKIILATDRSIGFKEVRRSGRSIDYDITLIELILDESTGKGQGSMAVAAKMKVNPESKTLEIENYGMEPVKFTSVIKSD